MDLPEGFVYRVRHERELKKGTTELSPFGGRTIVHIGYLQPHPTNEGIETEFMVVCEGHAKCRKNEVYNRKRGRDIALGRALKEYTHGRGATRRPDGGGEHRGFGKSRFGEKP